MPSSVREIILQKKNEACKSLQLHHIFNIVLHHQKFDDNFKRSRYHFNVQGSNTYWLGVMVPNSHIKSLFINSASASMAERQTYSSY